MKYTGKKFLNSKGKLIDLDTPIVMGILNTTPDSFFEKSRHLNEQAAVDHAGKMIEEGAEILDVGGYSSRPGAEDIPPQLEQDRVLPIIEAICKNFPDIAISIDTFRSEVARKAIVSGADIINDISGGDFDRQMFALVAELQVPYILMHMQGNPKTMQSKPEYGNIVNELVLGFTQKINQLRALGAKDIVLDPGFGFGKNLHHNYELLDRLKEFSFLGLPLLAGVSRKSMVNNVLNIKAVNALNGTTALHIYCLENGASILRVHDVKEAVEAVKIHKFVRYRENR